MPDVSALILAGGASSRLGRDKASTILNEKPLLQWVVDRLSLVAREIVIVKAGDQTLPEIETPLPAREAIDILPARGPLGGIYTGLVAAGCDLVFAAACDMPLISVDLVRALIDLAPGYDVVMPTRDGRPQPLHAVYRKTCVPAMRHELDSGNLRVVSFLPAVRVRYVDEEEWRKVDPDGLSFVNINTDEDLRRVGSLLK